MKKFYTLIALAATVGFTGHAFERTVNAAPVSADFIAKQRIAVPAPEVRSLAAATDHSNDTWKLLGDGIYKASVMADYYSASQETSVTIYESEQTPGVYKAVGVYKDLLGHSNQELIVDASDPSFVIVPKQDTGVVDSEDGATYIGSLTYVYTEELGYDKSIVIANDPEIVPSFANGVVTFPAQSLVLQWPEAPENSAYETDPTEWYAGDSAGALILPGADYVPEWELLGEGTVSGDFLCTLFGITPVDYQANIYRSTSEETKYKVENAFYGLYAGAGITSTSPDLILDATDPENVSIPMTNTGVGSSTAGKYYVASYSESLVESSDACPEDFRGKFSKDESLIKFSFPAKSIIVIASTTFQPYYGNSNEVTFSVKNTSAVNNIATVDNSNAPVEYFNLQGQMVKNPASGTLVIRKQGATVEKIVLP